jgi:two-component system chemotaxis sensor kinase CheA
MSDDFLKEIQEGFLLEADDLLEQAEGLFLALEKGGDDNRATFDHLKRIAHNFKGSGKAVGFDELSSFCHSLENLLVALSSGTVRLNQHITDLLLECNDVLRSDIRILTEDKSAPLDHSELKIKLEEALREHSNPDNSFDLNNQSFDAPIDMDQAVVKSEKSKDIVLHKKSTNDEFIRVPLKKIDELLNTFGEQVIFLSALDFYKEDLSSYKEDVIRTVFNLKRIAFDLQQSTLTLRMVTLKSLFSKLDRAIRDAAIMTRKKINTVINGGDNELDKVIVDQLSDPLIHMVRNAVDHGVENADIRSQRGKPTTGTIKLNAQREGGSFVIEVEDDGGGLDPDRIYQKGIERGLIKEGQQMTRSEIFELIFENGFSTKDTASELSGRGVGMNVVRETILSLKGSYEIISELNKGTKFRVKLPLSLSLFNGLLVMVREEKFVIPSSQIQEIVKINDVEQLEIVGGNRVIQIRNEVVELIEISSYLARPTSQDESNAKKKNMVLISNFEKSKTGFVVSQILGIQRIVQKPLSPEMTACPGASGVTILGDGSPAIILDLRTFKEVSQADRSMKVVA